MTAVDYNDLAYWFPRIRDAGLPVPRTEIVHTDVALYDLLDGKTPDGWDRFIASLYDAARGFAFPDVGESKPFFLRTGHTSGKHQWYRTCYVGPGEYLSLEHHVTALVEASALSSFFGLPASTWAVRELIPTTPICRCDAYEGMPVVREFRFFADAERVAHVQPYWPPEAVLQGRPDRSGWLAALAGISRLGLDMRGWLGDLACRAAAAAEGFWSVDLLQAEDGKWWITDMARGEDSYRYQPEPTS